MKIDDQVEDAVREAITSTIAGERDRFDSAVEAIAMQGDDFAAQAFNLASAISAIALFVLNDRTWPDGERIDELATAYVENEEWSAVDGPVVRDVLTSLAAGHSPLETVPVGQFAFAIFAITGWLVAGFQLPEGVLWNEFLDEIEQEIENQTD